MQFIKVILNLFALSLYHFSHKKSQVDFFCKFDYSYNFIPTSGIQFIVVYGLISHIRGSFVL